MTTITLKHICKIEGHASLDIKIDDGEIKKVDLRVVEGARFFENIVKGRSYTEVPALVSRICGICSASHCLSSIRAIEDAFGCAPSEQTKILRELLEYGEVLQSHIMHLFFMALPDYLGFKNALDMAKDHKKELLMALELKKLSQEFISAFSGREVHPISVIVGGFSKVPSREKTMDLHRRFKDARSMFVETVELFVGLDYPDFQRERDFFAIKGDYPFHGDSITHNNSKTTSSQDYLQVFNEGILPHSSAKIALHDGKPFFVGALARLSTNRSALSPQADRYPIKCANPYHNNLAQAIEMLHLCDRIIDILENLTPLPESFQVLPKAGRGVGITEAPRGLLIHDYTLDDAGLVTGANIITPTVLNLQSIEEDIKLLLPILLKQKRSKEAMILDIEKLIRSYDPCISCASHFLKVNWL